MNNPDNFSQLKSLFDAECERMKQTTDNTPAPLGCGDHFAPAAVLIKLFDGYSLEETKRILNVSFVLIDRLVDKVNREALKINAGEVEDIL